MEMERRNFIMPHDINCSLRQNVRVSERYVVSTREINVDIVFAFTLLRIAAR